MIKTNAGEGKSNPMLKHSSRIRCFPMNRSWKLEKEHVLKQSWGLGVYLSWWSACLETLFETWNLISTNMETGMKVHDCSLSVWEVEA